QGRGGIDVRPAAIGEQKRAGLVAAVLCYTIRKSKRQDGAGRQLHFTRLSPRISGSDIGPSPRHLPGVLGAAGAVAAKRIEFLDEIRIVPAESALGDEHGDLRGQA